MTFFFVEISLKTLYNGPATHGTVIHHVLFGPVHLLIAFKVDVALFPNMQGSHQRRYIKALPNEGLEIKTDPMPTFDGRKVAWTLTWYAQSRNPQVSTFHY